ncbi:hypothetical protein [Rhodoplanes sp. Z2-YC6860]|uniref:hypothetical protein n=1 Tax=Rhodoplanes sp. Z2-YC6860 TaxID=674703 RepID=UPI0012ED4494|nr:hypothetical protein [Rhodoplanes sp. Z2-YC6860]
MSRRITFIALAASATLIATHAVADRECFDDACRAQAAAEAAAAQRAAQPQTRAAQKPAASTAGNPANTVPNKVSPEPVAAAAAKDKIKPEAKREPVVVAKPEPATAPPAKIAKPEPVAVTGPEPVKAQAIAKSEPDAGLSSVIAEPAARNTQQPGMQQRIAEPQVPPRYRREEARPHREPARIMPQHAERHEPPVTADRIEHFPAYAPPPVVVDVPRQAPSIASAAVIEVPGEVQTSDGLVTVYPNLRPDPAWKLCQIDSRDLGHRAYRCTAYSYHPYGEGGYRPYGTYRNYPTVPGYVSAPNARIISIQRND